MTRASLLEKQLTTEIIAIIRLSESKPIFKLANALHKGGINAIEVTIGTPNVLEEINKLSQIEGVIPGVGSVFDVKTAQDAIKSGGEFVVTPVSKPEVIQMAHQYQKSIFSGAMTPSEILQAYEWGADVVKLFPAAILGLPYFKAITAPMPHLPIMPSGVITIETADERITNGDFCIGMGSTLVNKKLMEEKDFKGITAIAKALKEDIKND